MRDDERQKLINWKNEYISIGITQGGLPKTAMQIPWESTGQAYNMCTPNVYIAPEDLEDEEIMNMLKSYKVVGCYIWVPLTDYSFISNFEELWDLYIANGDKIRDLIFMENLNQCRMLFLQNAKLENLDIVLKLNKKPGAPFDRLKCVALMNCEVNDLTCFENEKHDFFEFLVWEAGENKSRKRWNVVNSYIRKYRKIKID